MTDATGAGHLVSEDAAVAGRRVGRYVTLCGVVVLAASLTTPDQQPCQRCNEMRGTCEALRRANPSQDPAGHRQWSRRTVKHTKSKKHRGLVTRRIIYRNHQRPHDRPQELKVDVRRGEQIDADYAAAMVAVRTGMSLENVKIVEVMEPDE